MNAGLETVSERARRVATIGRAVGYELEDRDATFMAGAIAYAGFVSLLPLGLLVVLAVAVVGDAELATFVDSVMGGYLNPTGQSLLADAVTDAAGMTQLSVLTLLVLGWGILKVFRNLDTAFSTMYRAPTSSGLVEQLRDGLVVLFGIGLATAAMFVAGTLYALAPDLPFRNAINLVGLILALSAAFFPIYYVFPGVDVSVREVLPGVLVAAVGWTLLQAIFQIYVSLTSTADVYGVVGGVLLFITWLYFGALVLLLGAATNVVLARRGTSDRSWSSTPDATADETSGDDAGEPGAGTDAR